MPPAVHLKPVAADRWRTRERQLGDGRGPVAAHMMPSYTYKRRPSRTTPLRRRPLDLHRELGDDPSGLFISVVERGGMFYIQYRYSAGAAGISVYWDTSLTVSDCIRD